MNVLLKPTCKIGQYRGIEGLLLSYKTHKRIVLFLPQAKVPPRQLIEFNAEDFQSAKELYKFSTFAVLKE